MLEHDRLQALYRYEVLDTPPEPVFDRLVQMAAENCRAPFAFLSLIDVDRIWFKARHGCTIEQAPRALSPCAQVVEGEGILEVTDTRADPRFAGYALIDGSPSIRFYAGAPLVTADGHRIGTLCIADRHPRPGLTAAERAHLSDLAALALDALERRRAERRLAWEIAFNEMKSRVLGLIASGAGLRECLNTLVCGMESLRPDLHASILEYDAARGTLSTAASPSLPRVFCEAIDGIRAGPKAGSCGTAAYRRERVVVHDIAADPLWEDFRDLTLPLGLRACWSEPILLLDGSVAGTFAFYYREPRGPSAEDLQILKVGANLAQVAIERHRAEQALRAARTEAEAASRAKTQFLAAASHDLRQPMQSATLLMDVLTNRLKDHPALDVVGHLGDALASLRDMLDGLLDLSKLDAGIVQPEMADLPVAALLERLRKQYAGRAAELGLELRVVGSPAWIRSDAVLLERMARNLVENALRYTERGRILLGCRQVGDQLRLEVHDTGIGIPADQLPAIFGEFVQGAPAPGGHGGSGLGLGLAIVQRLAQLLGHRVTARSTPGRGSCFAIHLPATTPPDGIRPRPEPLPVRGEGRVLLIDDEPSVLTALRLLVGGWGYEVLTAATLEEAERHAARTPPDAVVSDYRLLGAASGIDIIRRLQARHGPSLPGILLTGDTAPERLREAADSGLHLLHKPVAPEALRQALDMALRKAARRRGSAAAAAFIPSGR